MDPIAGLQNDTCYWVGDPGGIRQQLKAEQGQGHGHLQLVHGELFPNAVPGPRGDSEVRSGHRPGSELGFQGPPCSPALAPFTSTSSPALVHGFLELQQSHLCFRADPGPTQQA